MHLKDRFSLLKKISQISENVWFRLECKTCPRTSLGENKRLQCNQDHNKNRKFPLL